MSELLVRARRDFDARSWTRAFQGFARVDEDTPLVSDDLERMAVAAQLVGKDEASASAWERAHIQQLARGEVSRAVRCAFWVASGLFSRGEMARGGGWVGRAQRLVDEHELDGAEQGLLLIPRALGSLEQGDPETAHRMCNEAISVGERCSDVDLVTLGRLGQGRALVEMGRPAEGLPLLDEAMVAVLAGEVSPILAGRAYCAVILVCQKAFDFRRAHEWTAALSRWCDQQPDIVPFRGQCLVHRSEVMQWNGRWSEALAEAEKARERLSDPPGQPAIGMAFYQLGELYRLSGDFANAESSYREANRHGHEPQPGLANLRLMQGDIDAAAAALRRVMDEKRDYVTRSRVLGSFVEVMLAAGDPDAADAAAAELAELAAEVGSALLDAASLHAAGSISLGRGDHRPALESLRAACANWADLEVPYDLARTRVQVAVACRALGDLDTASLEADSARETFQRLGAAPDLDRLEGLMSATSPAVEFDALTGRQVEVLSLVASGKTNREIAEALTVSEHTVRRHLQNIFSRIGVTSRAAATAFAYEQGIV